MRTRRFFKYLMAMIIALGTAINAMAQERNLKIYFNEYSDTATAPIMLVTDDNNAYDIPAGVTVSAEGVAWAKESRFFGGLTQGVNDRLLADYIRDGNGKYYEDEKGNIYKKESHLKLTFTNFPYEVNMIQWNKMNDLFSGFSWSDLIMNYNIATKCVPVSGNGFSSSEEHWAMNVFTHNASFSKKDIPWQDGETLNGLTSFEINEGYDAKIGIGRLTFIDLGKKELSNKCRTFIKAGWNGSTTNSNITDGDDSDWAFKVKFTLPEISAATYTYDKKKQVHLQPDEYVYVGEVDVHAVKGYITAHQGAVDPSYNPNPDKDAFHFEYELKNKTETNFVIRKMTGAISKATVAGDYPVIVKLMRGNREVCSTEYTVHVSKKAIPATSAELGIGFADGKKGYDISVGDENAQIKGFIVKNAKDVNGDEIHVTPTEDESGYHFEYSEDSNGEKITINKLTGDITPKKEGNVQVTVVLKDGNSVISNPYTYTLHVFAEHEGLEFRRVDTYKYTTSDTRNSWKISNNQANQSTYEWNPNNLLSVNASLNHVSDAGANDWKQIAGFSVNSSDNWRAICQEIAFDIYVPKYTKASARYTMAGNAAIGDKKTHYQGWGQYSNGSCKYGFELFYLNQGNNNVDLATATTWLKNRNWDTNLSGSISNIYYPASWGTATYHSSIGDYGYYERNTDNASEDAPHRDQHRSYTVYFAAMAYLWNDEQYPGDVSIGFKGIPEYTYYTKVTYARNDGTGTNVLVESEWHTTTSKTETFKLLQGAGNSVKNMTRTGYEFLGWSTDPNATTPEYELEDDFPIYDKEHGGGGWGPVTLYAVWKPNNYIVELRHTSTGPVDGYVYATFDQPMPLVDVEGNSVVVPVHRGYDFCGYFAEKLGGGEKYYNADMSSNHVWDRAGADKNYVIASWIPHTTTVVFDLQGGIRYYGATEVTATYDQAMPTVGLYQGQSQNVSAPQRQGYTFGGYYSKTNGQGTQYYTADMTSARTWNIDERLLNPPTTEVTLYAKWIPNTYTVTLDPQGGTGGSSSTTATYGQPLSSGLTAPTKDGYEFKGYYSNQNQEYAESMGQDYGGTQYYDKDMNGVESWDQTQAGTIYAHWAPATYVVTLDAAGGVLPNNVIEKNESNFDIAIPEGSNGVMTITYKYKAGKSNTLVHAEAKKPGYELLGWFDSKGVKVIDASETSRNCTITDNGGYWTENGMKYNHIGDLTLTAHYRKKYKYADNVITFGKDENGKPERVEPDEDWLYSVVNDLVGAAKDVYDNEAGHPQTMVFDLRESIDRWTNGGYNCQLVMEDLMKSEYSEFISPNVLVYFNNDSYNADKCNNAILSDYTCPNLYVTDRFQMMIPYAFNAGKATYERNKAQIGNENDGMWQQSKESIWGTLCLPYPIKNNNTYNDVSKVIFYELRKKSGSVMQFNKLPEDAVIPANTPVLYERTVGISSAVTIEENAKEINGKKEWISVPDNPNFTAKVTSYANAPEPSIHDWEFRGNLKTSVFYGAKYVGTPEEADAQIVNDGELYYFKQNQFTHLTPAMTKTVNGKEVHYQAGKMTLYPYRAYFYKKGAKGTGGSAKVASYSILVVDEDGATLDITNTVFGYGEGDGKIYDLNGIRVMQPVKGRLYIVNGQKKVYR